MKNVVTVHYNTFIKIRQFKLDWKSSSDYENERIYFGFLFCLKILTKCTYVHHIFYFVKFFFFRFYSLRLSKWNEQRNKKRKEQNRYNLWLIDIAIDIQNKSMRKKKGGEVGNKIKKKKKKKNNRELNKIKKKKQPNTVFFSLLFVCFSFVEL